MVVQNYMIEPAQRTSDPSLYPLDESSTDQEVEQVQETQINDILRDGDNGKDPKEFGF